MVTGYHFHLKIKLACFGVINMPYPFEKSLKRDLDLTAEEKFELYYDEYLNRKKEKVHTIKSMLKDLGIDRSSDNK